MVYQVSESLPPTLDETLEPEASQGDAPQRGRLRRKVRPPPLHGIRRKVVPKERGELAEPALQKEESANLFAPRRAPVRRKARKHRRTVPQLPPKPQPRSDALALKAPVEEPAAPPESAPEMHDAIALSLSVIWLLRLADGELAPFVVQVDSVSQAAASFSRLLGPEALVGAGLFRTEAIC
jgi:hypothetical protein